MCLLIFYKKEYFSTTITGYNSYINDDITGSIKIINKNKKFYSIKNELDYGDMTKICTKLITNNININDSFTKTDHNNFINKIIKNELLKKINLDVRINYNTIYNESDFKILKIIPINTLINSNYNINNIELLIHIYRPNKTHYFILYFNIFIYLEDFKILIKNCKISGIKFEQDLVLKRNTITNNYCNYNTNCNVLTNNIDKLLLNRKKLLENNIKESKYRCIGKQSKTKYDCISYGPYKGEWK